MVEVGVADGVLGFVVGVGVLVAVGINVGVGSGVLVVVGVEVSVGAGVFVKVGVIVGVRVAVGGLTIEMNCGIFPVKYGWMRPIPKDSEAKNRTNKPTWKKGKGDACKPEPHSGQME